MKSIDQASLPQCADIASTLSRRLLALEPRYTRMASIYLQEAAQFLCDAATDIRAAHEAERASHCKCGYCDDCVAARLDILHDMQRDAVSSR